MSGKMTVITVAALIQVSTPEIFPSGGATSDGVLVHSSTELGPGLVPVVAKVRPTLSPPDPHSWAPRGSSTPSWENMVPSHRYMVPVALPQSWAMQEPWPSSLSKLRILQWPRCRYVSDYKFNQIWALTVSTAEQWLLFWICVPFNGHSVVTCSTAPDNVFCSKLCIEGRDPCQGMARYLKKEKNHFLMAVEKMSKKFPKSSTVFLIFFLFFCYWHFPSDLLEIAGRERNVRIVWAW